MNFLRRVRMDPLDALHILGLGAVIWGVWQLNHAAAWIIGGVVRSTLRRIGALRLIRGSTELEAAVLSARLVSGFLILTTSLRLQLQLPQPSKRPPP